MFGGGGEQFGGRLPAAGNHHARNVVTEDRGDDLQAVVAVEALDVADLAFAEDENAGRLEVFVKAGQSLFWDARCSEYR